MCVNWSCVREKTFSLFHNFPSTPRCETRGPTFVPSAFMMNLLFSLHTRISSVIFSKHLGVVFHTYFLTSLFFRSFFQPPPSAHSNGHRDRKRRFYGILILRVHKCVIRTHTPTICSREEHVEEIGGCCRLTAASKSYIPILRFFYLLQNKKFLQDVRNWGEGRKYIV